MRRKRVELFRYKAKDIKITISLYYNEAGQLIVDGFDTGKKVEEILGSENYNYMYKIDPVEVEKFHALFDVSTADKIGLLLEIRKRFGDNHAFSSLGSFMLENDIKYKAAYGDEEF
ncbi:MAG: hypothetical protein PHU69_10715 [Fermentimonas sp.]|nr:hypothetical protein [Fermentimonas sp.]